MNLHQRFLTQNDCYRAGRTIRPAGVMLHSTGANNPRLSRYVAPDDGRLGQPSGRHWNQSGVGACVHTFQADWEPGVGTESLYTCINEEHDGSKYDPIPYEGNMELLEGLYYVQDGVVYLCTRDTGSPVYHDLAALVGHYVERAEEK